MSNEPKTANYISSGETNGMYTLRSVIYRDKQPARDIYVCNLSTDWDKAYSLAAARPARLMTPHNASWELNEWGSGKTGRQNMTRYYAWLPRLEAGVMPFGKHMDETLADLPHGYRVWLRSVDDVSPAWKLLVGHLEKYVEVDKALLEIEAEYKRNKARIEEKKKAAREHVGVIKQRMEATLKCIRKIAYDGAFGPGTISILEDQKGNKIKTFGTCRILVDEAAKVKMTIKSHDEYKGEKQTTVTRVAVL